MSSNPATVDAANSDNIPSTNTKLHNSYEAIVNALRVNEDTTNNAIDEGFVNKFTPLTLASEISGTKNQVGSVLAFELEPGIYEISKWKVITPGGMDFAEFDAEGRSLITFEVKSGEVSYLCNCHITVDIGENIFGNAVEDGAEAAIYDKMQRDMQYVDEKYPSLGELKVNNIAANLRVNKHALAP
ncbi:hypothetical protein N9L91_00915 [Pseudomonadales bacterium]|nr:hypothetical protein [Pseudomonadales bacterium]